MNGKRWKAETDVVIRGGLGRRDNAVNLDHHLESSGSSNALLHRWRAVPGDGHPTDFSHHMKR